MEPERFVHETGAERITSRANPKTVLYAGLADRKKREEAGLFLAEGVKLTRDALVAAFPMRAVLLAEGAIEKSPEAVRLARDIRVRGIPLTLFADAAIEKISTEKAPQGIIAVLKL